MHKNDISNIIKIAAYICGKDGIISQAEEEKIFELVSSKYPSLNIEDFEATLDEFFDSSDKFEDYLDLIQDEEIRLFTLCVSGQSASVDGLDIKENIALLKAYSYWEVEINE